MSETFCKIINFNSVLIAVTIFIIASTCPEIGVVLVTAATDGVSCQLCACTFNILWFCSTSVAT